MQQAPTSPSRNQECGAVLGGHRLEGRQNAGCRLLVAAAVSDCPGSFALPAGKASVSIPLCVTEETVPSPGAGLLSKAVTAVSFLLLVTGLGWH